MKIQSKKLHFHCEFTNTKSLVGQKVNFKLLAKTNEKRDIYDRVVMEYESEIVSHEHGSKLFCTCGCFPQAGVTETLTLANGHIIHIEYKERNGFPDVYTTQFGSVATEVRVLE